MESLKPNKKQLEAITHGSGPLLIIAGAGTGKTTVVTERIRYLIEKKLALPSEILALTFTDKAAREMEERVDRALPYGLSQMWITTFHAFGDRLLRSEALEIGLDPGFKLMTKGEAIIFFRKHLFHFDLNYYRPLGNPGKFIEALLTHFDRLKDEDISPEQYLDWVKNTTLEETEKGKYLELSKAYQKQEELKVKEGLVDFADLIAGSLKLFRLRKNILKQYQAKFKYILIDEFQDTNYAQNQLTELLAAGHKNITVVGDDDQCLPPTALIETSKGRIAIKNIRNGDDVITAVGKGYLSTSKVLHVMKNKKTVKFITFVTESGQKFEVTHNHKMFCMIPGKKITTERVIFIYLMYRQGLGWRLGITDDLSQRLKLERSADKIIAIKSCTSVEEARYFESVYSLKYGIPTYPFKPRKRMILTEKWLRKLFSEFDTEKNAAQLANDLGVDLRFHHYCLGAVVRGKKERIKILLNMCHRRHRTKWARNRFLVSPKVNHLVSIDTSSTGVREILIKENIKIGKSKKGWRVRKYFSDLKEADNFAHLLHSLIGGTIEVKFDVGKRDGYSRPSLIMPAGNIFTGMYIPVKKSHEVIYERIARRNEKIKTESVYDLEVEKTHNFIADNIVIHNSIYRFRGAAVSNIIQFRKTYPESKIVVLTGNYRSSEAILAASYKLIQHNNPDRLEVKEKIDKKLTAERKIKGEEVEFIYQERVEDEAEAVVKKIKKLAGSRNSWSDFAILLRANNHAEPFIRALARAGIPYQFLGPGRLFKQKEVKNLIAYLKFLAENDNSVALYRVISMPLFDMAVRDLSAILNFSRKMGMSLYESLDLISGHHRKIPDHWSLRSNYRLYLPYLSEKTVQAVIKFTAMIENHLQKARNETAGQLLFSFLEDSGLLQKLTEYKTSLEEKEAVNISRFFDKLKSYETDHDDASIFAVNDWIDMAIELGESPLAADTDWVGNTAFNILTVHSSKGLEFPVVFLVNLVAERFPTRERSDKIPIPDALIKEILPEGDYHLQEERRLFYVGATRARDRLFLSAANYYGEGKRERKISSFVSETLGKQPAKMEQEANQLNIYPIRKLIPI